MRTMIGGRRLSLAIIAIACLALTHAYAASPTTITGEVVETFCWATLSVAGPPHAACGIECAKRGIPIAIVDAKTRTAFILLPGRDKASLPPKLVDAMGRRVTIRGEVFSRGGLQFLSVHSWQRAR